MSYSADGVLWVMKPRVVFEARVNLPAASYPLATIPYDGVTTGAYTDLEQNQTVLIGSAPGKWDLGRTYLRGDGVYNVATSSVINVGYSSRGRGPGSVDALDNAYITVLDLHEVWLRPSRDGKLDGSILKDYDLGVPQNYAPLVQINNGFDEGGVGMLDVVDADSGVLEVELDATGSHFTKPGGGQSWWDIYTTWDVKDGTITVGAEDDFAITAEFPPGYRYVRWRGVSTDGKFSLPRMYCVVALDATLAGAAGEDGALLSFHRVRWDETAEGQTLTAQFAERLDPADFVPGTLVLWAMDEGTGWRLRFGGWLESVSSTVTATEDGVQIQTTLTAQDVGRRLDALKANASTMARDDDEPYANTMRGAHPTRYAWWYLRWHTSAPMVANVDLNFSYSEDYPFPQFGFGGGSHYSAPDTLARAIALRLTCDETGWLKFLPDPQRQDEADRTSDVQATITEMGWRGIARSKKRDATGALRATAVLATPQDADAISAVTEYYAVAPGLVEAQGATATSVPYPQLVRSEAELWRRIGHDLKRMNPDEEVVSADVAPWVAAIHPSRMTWVALTAAAAHVGWNDEALSAARCLPQKVSYTYVDEAQSIDRRVTLERETVGAPGTRDPRPPLTTTRTVRNPVQIPRQPPASLGLLAGTPTIAAFNTDGGLYLFSNFDQPTPTAVRVALDSDLIMFIVDAFSPLYLGTGGAVNGMVLRSTEAFWVEDIFGSQTQGTPHALAATAFTASMQSERVTEGLFAIALHPDDGRIILEVTEDRGQNWTTLTNIGGIYVGGSGDGVLPGIYVSAHVPNKIIFSAFVGTGATGTGSLYQSLDNGGSASALNAGNTFLVFASDMSVGFSDTAESNLLHGGGESEGGNYGYRLYRTSGGSMSDISPTDGTGAKYGPQIQFAIGISPQDADIVYLAGRHRDVGGRGGALFRSTDGGDTWTQQQTESTSFPWVGVLVAGDNPNVIYLLGNGAGGKWLGYSEDGGVTIQDKSGNIPSAYPGAGRFVNLAGGG